jgi:hypothetical protein
MATTAFHSEGLMRRNGVLIAMLLVGTVSFAGVTAQRRLATTTATIEVHKSPT